MHGSAACLRATRFTEKNCGNFIKKKSADQNLLEKFYKH